MEYHQRRVTRLAGLITYRIDIFDGEMKIERKKMDVADKKGLKLNCMMLSCINMIW
ncbi:hypothetical protein WN48_05728 [Eufriesea mexicana]|uniref:Uncharacterized protein n=1 Tax=Eufriesea mexicana TaxID=516756 RepID=A0A310SA04_9HYME|nr:hypothetical protein WN48_05728 [Eufriesea mexicana]